MYPNGYIGGRLKGWPNLMDLAAGDIFSWPRSASSSQLHILRNPNRSPIRTQLVKEAGSDIFLADDSYSGRSHSKRGAKNSRFREISAVKSGFIDRT